MKWFLTPAVLVLTVLNTASSLSANPMVTLPAHTLIPVVEVNHLKSGQSREGDDVEYKTFATVYGPHHEVLIPVGSEGHGKITESKGSGMAGKGGKLKFTCDYVVAGDNSHVTFFNADLSKQGHTYNPITMYLVGGALLLFAKGRDIDVDEGTPFIMEVDADTQLHPVQDSEARSVMIVPNKRNAKGYPANITGFTAESITVTTDKGESSLELKDVKQIILPPQAQTITTGLTQPITTIAPVTTTIDAIPAAAVSTAAPQSLFTFANGAQTVGILIGFDGNIYNVSTPKGMRQFKKEAITSIRALPSTPITASTAPR